MRETEDRNTSSIERCHTEVIIFFFACLFTLISNGTFQNFQIILMRRVHGDDKDGSSNNVGVKSDGGINALVTMVVQLSLI